MTGVQATTIRAQFVRFAAILGVLTAASWFLRPAAAETVRDACTQDALRLCADTVPDVAKTQACLARHRASLSRLCRTAFGTGRSRYRR